jgi:CHAD domain-containing protein
VAHRVGRKEDAAAALLRIVGDDLDGARADLERAGPREEQIHLVRQRLKRVRTLLRVLEPEFGDRAVAARRDVAAIARLLATARDADVVAASARTLAAATAAIREDVGFDRLCRVLEREAATAHRQKTPLAEVKQRLAATADTVAAFGTDFDGKALFDAALKRTYRRGQRAMRQAETSLATPDLHRWRMEVKRLWHLIRSARRQLPTGGHRLARRLDRLGELLGLDHDHAMLAEKLALSPAGDPALMRQLSVIAERRRTLEAEAFDLGASIYRRKPRAFARRVHLI